MLFGPWCGPCLLPYVWRSFLGLANYYRKFVKDFAKISLHLPSYFFGHVVLLSFFHSFPYLTHSLEAFITFTLLTARLLFYCTLVMALSFVVECNGFQHGGDPFTLKCLAVSCGRLHFTYTRIFDTSALLTSSPDAFQTYRYQTAHHGLTLASQGLPQSAAQKVFYHTIQEALLELAEEGAPAPPLVILWVKGGFKLTHLRNLIGTQDTQSHLSQRTSNLYTILR